MSRNGVRYAVIRTATTTQSLIYRGRRGSRYRFRVTATGWNGAGAPSSVVVSVPASRRR